MDCAMNAAADILAYLVLGWLAGQLAAEPLHADPILCGLCGSLLGFTLAIFSLYKQAKAREKAIKNESVDDAPQKETP
jgi:F0F1-type ATP synthase assembly protein I